MTVDITEEGVQRILTLTRALQDRIDRDPGLANAHTEALVNAIYRVLAPDQVVN